MSDFSLTDVLGAAAPVAGFVLGGPVGALAGAGIGSSLLGSNAADRASQASADAANAATAEQARQFDINQANLSPYLQTGTAALQRLNASISPPSSSPYPSFSYTGQIPTYTPPQDFNFDVSHIAEDPAYKWLYDQTMKATDRAMAAGGGYNSGGRLTALQDRAAGLASQFEPQIYNQNLQTYNTNAANNLNAYQIAQQNEQNQFGRAAQTYGLNVARAGDINTQNQQYLNWLATLSGVGQNAVGTQAQLGATTASNIGNIAMSNAQNQGNAAIMGNQAINNAVQGTVGNYLGYLNNQAWLNRIPTTGNPFYTWNGGA